MIPSNTHRHEAQLLALLVPLYLTTGAPYSSYPFTPFQPLPEPTPSTTLLASFAFHTTGFTARARVIRYGRDLPFCLFVSTVLS